MREMRQQKMRRSLMRLESDLMMRREKQQCEGMNQLQ
jgi:hypothetical protein